MKFKLVVFWNRLYRIHVRRCNTKRVPEPASVLGMEIRPSIPAAAEHNNLGEISIWHTKLCAQATLALICIAGRRV